MTNATIDWSIDIPMRDGVVLRGRFYHPTSAPAPVLLTMSPYGCDRDHAFAMCARERGYGVALVDCRGRGESDGQFNPSFCDAEDGFDTVEILAQHPACNGQVAMFGGSYQGENQWATAAARPPHLAAIAPAAATHMPAETAWRGPQRRPYMALWFLLVAGRTADFNLFGETELWEDAFARHYEAGAAFRHLPKFLGGTSPWFETYLDLAPYDAAWDALAIPQKTWATLDLPVLTITGLHDDAQIGALSYVQQHEAAGNASRHHVVIGPWDHAGTRSGSAMASGADFGAAARMDVAGLTLDFFDWVLRDGPQPAQLSARVSYFDRISQIWYTAPSLAQATAENRDYTLEDMTPDPTPIMVIHSDPASVPVATASRPVFPYQIVENTPPDGSEFRTKPLQTQLRLTGKPTLTLMLSTDLPDADLEAILAGVMPDGQVLILGEDRLRLRYRAAPEGVVFDHSDQVQVRFTDFPFTAATLPAGSQLRLTVRPLASIHIQRNFQGGGKVDDEAASDAKAGNITLYLNRSVLSLPLASQ